MELFKDNIPPPLGITVQEWDERKRKLKRKAWKHMLLLMLVTVFLGEYMAWQNGGYETIQPKRLEELQVKSGVCVYQTRRAGANGGIEDNVTGDRMFFDQMLVHPPNIKEFKGHPATVWYYVGQGKIKYVYQLKLDDALEFDIETANQAVEEFNERAKKLNLNMRIGWNLVFLVFWPLLYSLKCRGWLLKEK